MKTVVPNVGIGTTSPSDKLHISGGGLLLHDSNGGSTNRLKMSYDGISGIATIGADSSGGNTDISIGTSSAGTYAEKMRITSSGDVGIGTSSPSTKLHVESGTTYGAMIKGTVAGPAGLLNISNTNAATSWNFGVETGSGWASGAAGTFYIDQDGVGPKIAIVPGGNVGIGTSVPASKLEVAGAIRSPASQITSGSYSGSSDAIDFNNGNAQTTSSNCSALSFTNMNDGGAYTLVVTDTGTSGCAFPATINGGTSVTWKGAPSLSGHVRTASSHTVYSLLRVGTNIYVSWITGF